MSIFTTLTFVDWMKILQPYVEKNLYNAWMRLFNLLIEFQLRFQLQNKSLSESVLYQQIQKLSGMNIGEILTKIQFSMRQICTKRSAEDIGLSKLPEEIDAITVSEVKEVGIKEDKESLSELADKSISLAGYSGHSQSAAAPHTLTQVGQQFFFREKKNKAGFDPNQHYQFLIEKLGDPHFKDDREFIKQQIRDLKEAEKNSKIKDTTSKLEEKQSPSSPQRTYGNCSIYRTTSHSTKLCFLPTTKGFFAADY